MGDDAFGQALWDHHRSGTPIVHMIERDDGLIDAMDTAMYFTSRDGWPGFERDILRDADERVLDIGCGAGRHALALQEDGHAVTAIDPSPLAVKVCRARGVRRARVKRLEDVALSFGRFDSFLMIGHNLGLFRSPRIAPSMLRRLARVAAPGARIIGSVLDPFQTDDPAHRAYHRRNRACGRLAGQLRLRVRYRNLVGAWFDYLFVSKPQLRAIVGGTPWRIERLVDADPHYGVVLALK